MDPDKHIYDKPKVDGEENIRDSRLFPAIVSRGIMHECNRGIIDEDVYLSITANESICKCRNGRKLGEVDECKLSILKTGGLNGCP